MRILYHPWLLILLVSAVFVVGSWHTPLFDKDEGAFAEATREMLENGQFLRTTLNGEPRYDKPMLTYWAQGLSSVALGSSELAYRLPSILAALLWALFLYRFTRQTLGRDEAGIATLSFATALMVSLVAKWATADALLNLFISLAMFDIWRYAEHREAKHGWRVYLWLGLGVLTKGPIIIAIAVLAGVPWALWSGRLGALWGLLGQPAGWAAFVLVAAPWYVANAITPEGREFLHHFIFDHNVTRFTSTREGHGGYYWYYLVVAPLVLLPFTGWFFSSLRRLPRISSAPLDRFLWLWFFAVLLIFSLSATQLPHYIVYGLTPLFVLFGRYHAHFTNRWLSFGPAIVFFAVLALVPSLLFPLLSASRPDVDAGLLGEITRAATGWPYAVITLSALIAAVLIATTRRLHPWHGMLALGLLQAVVVALVIAPAAAALEQTHVRAAGKAAAALPEARIVAYRYRRPSFSVYRDAVTPNRLPAEGEVLFTEQSTLSRLGDEFGWRFEHLFASGYVAMARVIAVGDDPQAAPAPPATEPLEALANPVTEAPSQGEEAATPSDEAVPTSVAPDATPATEVIESPNEVEPPALAPNAPADEPDGAALPAAPDTGDIGEPQGEQDPPPLLRRR